ncbi:MAG: BREX system P-loop protein BrxC, partial [Planctomycetia bacterium]|nr:BREX system P-loop protein BrxC [Planctomycetia bacterium]
GAPRHYGGSNRTIIKQAYEMLVSDRTAMARKPVGTLVTLDKVYELVEGNLSSEKRKDIGDISDQFLKDPDDHGWALRVAKVICLLEFVRDLPRTPANIAAFLTDEIGKQAPLPQVQEAVQKLRTAQFIRETQEGWKLQTAQEKNWDIERRSIDPKPRDRNEITRQVLKEVFGEPSLKTYKHKEFRNFRIGVSLDGVPLEDGDLSLTLGVADDLDDLSKTITSTREESRQKSHENDLYWVFATTPEIDELVAQLHASRKMVEKYDQLRAQNKISPDEAICLQDEKTAALNHESRLRDKLTEAMERGTGLFRGIARDAASLGKNLGEILKKLYGHVVPDLYPKLELGSRPLKGTEAEDFLKAVDLKALPSLFYT